MTDLIILDVDFDQKYKTVNLTCVEDPRLSWGAKGVHLYLSSRPPFRKDGSRWEISKAEIQKRSKGGRDQLEGFLDELKLYGYLEIVQDNAPGTGYRQTHWKVYQFPTADQDTENQYAGNQDTGNQHTANQDTGNPQQIKTNPIYQKKESIQKELLFCACCGNDLGDRFLQEGKHAMCLPCFKSGATVPDKPVKRRQIDYAAMFEDFWVRGGWVGSPSKDTGKKKYIALLKKVRNAGGLVVNDVLLTMGLDEAHAWLIHAITEQREYTRLMQDAGLFAPEMSLITTWLNGARWGEVTIKTRQLALEAIAQHQTDKQRRGQAPAVDRTRAKIETNLSNLMQGRAQRQAQQPSENQKLLPPGGDEYGGY